MKTLIRKPFMRIIMITLIAANISLFMYAETDAMSVEKTITPDTTKTLHSGKSFEITFTTFDSMVFMLPITITSRDDIRSGGFRIILKDENGVVHQDDSEGLSGYNYDDVYESWFFNDEFILPKGTYTYTVTNTSNGSFKCEYSISGFTKISDKASIKKNVSGKSGTWVRIGKLGAGLPFYDHVKTSNKKVASDVYVQPDGKAYVFAEGKGKAKVSFKLKNGKRYTVKVKVTPGWPDIRACLYDYDRGKNYFIVKLKNCGKKIVEILTKGSKVVDGDKKDTRKLKAPSKITIKPGKSKTIKFRVIGKKTYYDYSVFTLYAKLKYEGRTYQWHTWDADSVIKVKKSWYSTYWKENDYKEWLYRL